MLSFSAANGKQVAFFNSKVKAQSKLVYYNSNGDQVYDENDPQQGKTLRLLEYGLTANRYKKNSEQLEIPERRSILVAPVSVNRKDIYRERFLPFLYEKNKKKRVVITILGQAGSGKSYLADQLSTLYSKLMKCYYISPVPESDTYKVCKQVTADDLVEIDTTQFDIYRKAMIRFKQMKRYIMSPEDEMKLELKIDELRPKDRFSYKFTKMHEKVTSKESFMIFDDVENEPDKKVQYLIDQALIIGRHWQMNVLNIIHNTNGAKTRMMMQESNVYVMFGPYSHAVDYCLKKYVNAEQNLRQYVKSVLNSTKHNYVAIYKNEQLLVTRDEVITM